MKQRRIFLLALIGALLCSVQMVKAQIGMVDKDAKVKPTLIILGSYHFANPGRDVVKSKVTDVSKPERQQQILEMIARLKKYKPTKIVLECDVETGTKFEDNFAKYLAGSYQLSVNERDQLGFRLAKELGIKIYCADTNTDSPGKDSDYDYMEFAAKHPELNAYLKDYQSKMQADGNRRDELFSTLSITKQFVYLNEPAQIENDHTHYFYLPRIGQGTEYIGANWLASWYGRNLKILANIIRITDSPSDRILAIYGAGHLKLLNQFATESKFYNVESPLKYLK